MAETREILSVGCKRHERLNAVLADQHGEVPSFLGWSDQESVTTAGGEPLDLLIELAEQHYRAERAFIRSGPSPSTQP